MGNDAKTSMPTLDRLIVIGVTLACSSACVGPSAAGGGQVAPAQAAPGQVVVGQAVAGHVVAGQASPGQILGGRLVTGQSVDSSMLRRPIRFSVYLPAAARVEAKRRFAVLYLLHGKGDDETTWGAKGDIAATLDRKIAAGEMQPMIVVMPGAQNSWYVDDVRSSGLGFGPFASAFAKDLMPAIDSRYPTATCGDARAIGGLSMGGYGSILYAVSSPTQFRAAFSLSGSLFSEESSDIDARRPAYGRIFGGVFGEPFDKARFLDWNVFMRLDRGGEAVKHQSFWLMSGDDDFPSIVSGTFKLHRALRQRGIESELRIVDGEHTWELWKEAVSPALTWLSGRLNASCPK